MEKKIDEIAMVWYRYAHYQYRTNTDTTIIYQSGTALEAKQTVLKNKTGLSLLVGTG
jgi:hypothetical protein